MNSGKKITLIAFVSVVVIAALAFLYTKEQPSGTKDNTGIIKIGAILPLTGPTAFLGELEKVGLEAARSLLAEQDNINVAIIYEDSKNQAKDSINAFSKLSQDKSIKGIVATHSGVTGPISEFIASRGDDQYTMPAMIGTIVASMKITQNNEVALRCYPSGRDEGQTIALFAANELGLKKAAVIYQNDDYGLDGYEQFSKKFKESDGQIVVSESFEKTSNDHRALIYKVLSEKPQCIYVVGNTPGYAQAFKQLDELGYDGVRLGAGTIDTIQYRQLIGPEAVKDIYYTATFSENAEYLKDAPKYDSYKLLLKSRGKDVNVLNIYSAVSLQLLAYAIDGNPNGSTKEIVDYLTTKKHQTYLGRIGFDSDRNIIIPVIVKQAKGLGFESDITFNQCPLGTDQSTLKNESKSGRVRTC